MTIVQMSIQPHQGYGADQIETETTLGKFIEHLQEAAQEWGEDAKLITVDFSNRYGASYGGIRLTYGETFELAKCEENEDQLPCDDCEAISPEFCTCDD